MSRRLKALRVGNFKAFADTQTIPIKPITLVFGPNSAGKSSFIHSLALAHEAQFGREKRSLARLDVRHTDIGGSAIDLGGFRQFVHRGQMARRVAWGAEISVAELQEDKARQQLAQLLESVISISINLEIGIRLDDNDRPIAGAEPKVESVAILADGQELLSMSRRSGDAGREDFFRIDRLDHAHEVFARLQAAIIELNTTATEFNEDDWSACGDAITDLLPVMEVKIGSLFPTGVDIDGAEASASPLYPISKGTREEDITKAVFFLFPRSLNDLVKGVSEVFAEELKNFQYLGPLRSFPARHLAFAENEDANWYAGGGYAWDVVRRDEGVRNAVNDWLGMDKLKTKYELRIKELVSLSSLRDVELEASDSWEFSSPEEDSTTSLEESIKDDYENYSGLLRDNAILEGRIESVHEMVLVDKRSKTTVTHRDVGIGISQVLPVLVMAYASRGKLLAMEQPEIHLHPALQAELGDVFIESALGECKNTFILETHSEHLILRLLRRVREGKLSPDDIAVLYVQPTENGSSVVQIRVDEDGDFIDRWPGGFFEEAFSEREAGR